MERLTRKIINIETGKVLAYILNSRRDELKAYRKLGELEDLEEQGLLLRLPCKVGDTVYRLWYACDTPYRVQRMPIKRLWQIVAMIEDNAFGKTIFLTREEAEAALEKLKGE